MDIKISEDERLDFINEDLKIIQRKNGLTFGTDSYLLSAFARKMGREDAADLGCGTGVASLLCAARRKYKKIYALELQEQFADIATRNAELNGLEDRVVPICCDLRKADEDITPGSLGAVFSNPPYMPKNSGAKSEYDEMNSARREENGTISDFCSAAARMLRHGGIFTVVYRPERLCELVFSMKSVGLEPKRTVLVYPDRNSPPCLVLVEAKKGASPAVQIARPLIIYESEDKTAERKYTEDMDRVYNDFSLDHLFSKGE